MNYTYLISILFIAFVSLFLISLLSKKLEVSNKSHVNYYVMLIYQSKLLSEIICVNEDKFDSYRLPIEYSELEGTDTNVEVIQYAPSDKLHVKAIDSEFKYDETIPLSHILSFKDGVVRHSRAEILQTLNVPTCILGAPIKYTMKLFK